MIQRLKLSGKQKRNHRDRFAKRRLVSESLETRALLAGDLMQNPASVTDVNADGLTTPIDALFILNELNSGGARSLVSGEDPAQPLFYDVNGDEFLSPVDALMVLNKINAEGEDDLLVQIRLEVTDTEDNVITEIDPGSDFVLKGYVQDLTARDDGGVFAGYMDVNYTSDLVVVDGEIEHIAPYSNGTSGDVSEPGLLDEIGSFDGFDPLGPTERLLFSINMEAQNAGTATFAPSFADETPLHDVLIYGFDDAVLEEEIMFVGTTLEIGSTDAPVAVDDMYSTPVETELQVDAANGVLANDVDPGGGTLTASLVSDVSNGTLTLESDGSFSYTPAAEFVGTDSFTYVASNVGASSNEATVEITVDQVNRPPVAVDDEYSTDEDTPLNEIVGVLINDFDPDGDDLNARVVVFPSNGSVQMDGDGTFVYTPNDNFTGTDTFRYVANDGLLDSNEATVTVEVQPVNDRPVANPDAYSTPKEMELVVNADEGVLANDVDVDGDGLTASLVTTTSNGVLSLADDGSFTYTPDLDFVGVDSFTYVAIDSGGLSSDPATVSIDVLGDVLVRFRLETTNANGVPISSIGPGGEFLLNAYVEDVSSAMPDGVFAAYMDVFYTNNAATDGDPEFNSIYPNGQRFDLSEPGLIDEIGAFDGFDPVGGGEILFFSIPFVADNIGTIVFESDPADDLPSNDVLLFNRDDAVPEELIDYGTTSITIEQGEPPVAVDDEYETLEDVELVVSAEDGVLANDVDPDGDELTAVLVDSTANGSLQLNLDGSFVYTPNENFFGTDTFTYQASDAANLSNVATVTIDVIPVNDAPIAIDDEYTLDDAPELIVDAENGVLANDIEVEGEAMTAVLVDTTSNGVLDLADDGSFVYTPDDGFIGRDTFTYQAQSGDLLSNIATVTIDVGSIVPSSIHGLVYFDVNNDGEVNNAEDRIANVVITLRGTNLLGEEIFLETTTATDGSYSFTNILQGDYVVTQFQPLFTVDGKDTINGEESLRNDRFIVDLPAGVDDGSYNFGERGLEPQFIGNPLFFASRQIEGLWTQIDADGLSRWYNADLGWNEFDSIVVELNSSMTAVTVTARADDFVSTSEVRLIGNREVHLTGDDDGYIFRLEGQPEDHGIQRPSLAASAVDAAFSDDE